MAFTLASLALIGWAWRWSEATTLLPGQAAMQPVTAICIALTSVVILLRAFPGQITSRIAVVLSILVVGAATWTLVSYVIDVPLPLDHLLFSAAVTAQTEYPTPGRMGQGTALAILPIAAALSVMGHHTARSWVSWLVIPGLFTPALALIGYLLKVDLLHSVGLVSAIALSTTLALLLLATGTLALPPPTGWILRLVGSGPGARTARLLLPITILGPIAAVFVLDVGVRVGVYESDFRLALLAVLITLVLSVTVLWHARRLDLTEVAIRDSEERLRRVVEGAPFPILVHAEDNEILHVSRACLELTGYDTAKIATLTDWMAHTRTEQGDATFVDLTQLHITDRPVDDGDIPVRTANGRTLLWSFRSAPLGRDERGRRLVVRMAADQTEQRETEVRLRLLMREVDHRAKNALAVVQSVLQLSRSDDPQTYMDAVEGRIGAIARAHTLLAETGWSGADLHRLIEDGLAAFTGQGRVEISGVPAAIRPESAQAVSMVLHELMTNAAKYGSLSVSEGRIHVTWESVARDGSLRLIWIEDGGPRLSGPPACPGFGCLMLHSLIESQLSGDLIFDWRPQGLRCSLRLPADVWIASGVAEPSVGKEAQVSNPMTKEARRVLVVEDEALTALALKRVLEDAGFVIKGPVGRVQDALDLIRAEPPDIAVLDVNLFGETVKPVAEALYHMNVPFVFCTGYQSPGISIESFEKPTVLRKPVNSNKLISTIETLLRNQNCVY